MKSTLKRNWSALVVTGVTLLTWTRGLRRAEAARRNPRWPEPPEPAAWPPVSVIVPAWKERDTLDVCLALLSANDYPNFDVIVAAGGPDGTYASACRLAQKMSGVRVIEQQPRGKNAALNQALPYAKGDVIVFLDADSQIGPDWLRCMVAPLAGSAAATTGNYFPLRATLLSRQGEMTKVLEYEVRGRVIVQGSGGIAVRRGVLDALGPFPEGAYSSDWDLNARLELGGYSRAFVPGAVTISHRPATWRDWWKNELRWRRLHLLSLFRLKSSLLREPLPSARHLYPYVVAWGALVLSVAWLLAWLPGRQKGQPIRAVVGRLWTVAVGAALGREAASALEALAYTRDPAYLLVAAATPVLSIAGWAACVGASVTSTKATVHFKGPRGQTPQRASSTLVALPEQVA